MDTLLILYYPSFPLAVPVVLRTAKVTGKGFKLFQADEKYSASRVRRPGVQDAGGSSVPPDFLAEGGIALHLLGQVTTENPNTLHFTDATTHLEGVSFDVSASDCLGSIQRTRVFTGLIQFRL